MTPEHRNFSDGPNMDHYSFFPMGADPLSSTHAKEDTIMGESTTAAGKALVSTNNLVHGSTARCRLHATEAGLSPTSMRTVQECDDCQRLIRDEDRKKRDREQQEEIEFIAVTIWVPGGHVPFITEHVRRLAKRLYLEVMTKLREKLHKSSAFLVACLYVAYRRDNAGDLSSLPPLDRKLLRQSPVGCKVKVDGGFSLPCPNPVQTTRGPACGHAACTVTWDEPSCPRGVNEKRWKKQNKGAQVLNARSTKDLTERPVQCVHPLRTVLGISCGCQVYKGFMDAAKQLDLSAARRGFEYHADAEGKPFKVMDEPRNWASSHSPLLQM